MSYLIDTNVLSETRKRVRDPGVTAWITTTPIVHQHLSALSVGEIGRGIERLRRRNDHAQAEIYATWLEDVITSFGARIVPVTVGVAREWGRQDPGHPASTADALIGATAKANGWTLVTRNTRDFSHVGIPLLNPFTGQGEG